MYMKFRQRLDKGWRLNLNLDQEDCWVSSKESCLPWTTIFLPINTIFLIKQKITVLEKWFLLIKFSV